MKKIVFLLILAVALIGIVFAKGTAHPPGALTLEAELSGDVAGSRAVTPDTVLAEVVETPQFVIDRYTRAVERYGRGDRHVRYAGHIIKWAEQYEAGLLSKQSFDNLVVTVIVGVEQYHRRL